MLNRRLLLQSGMVSAGGAAATRFGWLAGSGLIAASAAKAAASDPDEAVLAALTKAADAQIAVTLEGYRAAFTGSPRDLTRLVRRLVTPFVAPRSGHRHDAALLGPIDEILKVLAAWQHADGTFSVGNRHSPPDTGFLIEDMGVMSSILGADDHPESTGIAAEIVAMMTKAGPGLAAGGVHTPNHRWKICAALARIGHVTGDKAYVGRIDEWFAEEVDVDADGIYSERSPTYAAAVTNPSLLVVAHVLDRPDLLDIVRSNLESSIVHSERNGEIEAIHSRRQDQDHRLKLIRDFYLQYRELALLDGNGRFAAIARGIEKRHGPELGDMLGDLLERPELAAVLPADAEPFADGVKHYPSAGLVRIRRGDISASIFGGTDWYAGGAKTPFHNRIGSGLSTSPTFLKLWAGEALLEAVRLVPNFFSMGHFRSNGIALGDDGGVRLGEQLEIPYYLPMPPEFLRTDGDYALSRSVDGRFYSKLDFENRPVQLRRLATAITITEADAGLDVAFDMSGEEAVEMTIELTFRDGGAFEFEGATAVPTEDGDLHLTRGIGRYRVGTDAISFGPGNGAGLIEAGPGEQYTWANGALTVPGKRVYITGRTPLRYTLALRKG